MSSLGGAREQSFCVFLVLFVCIPDDPVDGNTDEQTIRSTRPNEKLENFQKFIDRPSKPIEFALVLDVARSLLDLKKVWSIQSNDQEQYVTIQCPPLV